LKSWVTELVETKEKLTFFGALPNGYIQFSSEGRVFSVLTAEERKPVKSEADQIAAFSTLVAYAGCFKIDGNKLITTVEVSADPAMVGKDLVRFYKCDADTLDITTAPFVSDKHSHDFGGKILQSYLLWQREKRLTSG
jgi:hypothetical protein